MKTLSSAELRANLFAVMDRVNDDHEPVIVHRAKGKPVVMVSLEDWASMDETTYLLSSPANARMLPSACRRNARICGSVYLLVFIQNLFMPLAEKILLMQPLTFGGG